MKKTMFKKVLAGIAAVFTIGLCVPTGFTGTDFKPSFETVAESGNGWTLENGVLTVSKGTTIDGWQFRGNTSIKKVIIGDNCTIGENVFWECTALESVTIGSDCTIGERAFWECTALESVTIGSDCTIGERAFWKCIALENVTIGNGCTIGKMAFWYCTALKNVTIGDNCTIEFRAFDGCNSIQKVSCIGDKNTVTVDNENPEIIYNKDKWTIITGTICPKCYCNAIDYKCKSCGYFDEAAAQAEIDRIQKLIDENKSGNTTASTFSDGSVLAIIGCSTFLVLCGLAAVIIVKRRKKTQ